MTRNRTLAFVAACMVAASWPFMSGGCDPDNRFLTALYPSLQASLLTLTSGLVNAVFAIPEPEPEETAAPPVVVTGTPSAKGAGNGGPL